MSDQEKYKKKYLALKKQMEGGQKQIGGFMESAMSAYTADVLNNVGTKNFQDLLICPIVLVTNQRINTTGNHMAIQKIITPGSKTLAMGSVMLELDDDQMQSIAIKDDQDLPKGSKLEEFIFQASLANGDLYRIIMNNMRNPFILEYRIEEFCKKHSPSEVISVKMKELMRYIVKDDNRMLKFILNSFNVVNLLSKDFPKINDTVSKEAYNLVLQLFSIQPFAVVNEKEQIGRFSEFSRHANRLLHYFGPNNKTYIYIGNSKYNFVVYPSQNEKHTTNDVSFLVATNGTYDINKNDELSADRRVGKEKNWPEVHIELKGATITNGIFDYSIIKGKTVPDYFDLFTEGQKATVKFSRKIDPIETTDKVVFKKVGDKQFKFFVFFRGSDKYPFPTSFTILDDTMMTFIADGE